MKNKKTAVVFGGTKEYLFAMAVTAMSMLHNSPNLADEIVIFHDGIPETKQEVFKRMFPTRFILYMSPFTDISSFHYVVKEHYTLMVFTKYECLRLLKEYKTVIWMDYDMLITGNISELLDEVPGGVRMILSNSLMESLLEGVDSKDFEMYKSIGVHSSIFVLYDSVKDPDILYRWCIEQTKRLSAYLYLPEQAILAMMIQKFKLPVISIPFSIYSAHPLKCEQTVKPYVKIWHTYGMDKYWNTVNDEAWQTYYKLWQDMH